MRRLQRAFGISLLLSLLCLPGCTSQPAAAQENPPSALSSPKPNAPIGINSFHPTGPNQSRMPYILLWFSQEVDREKALKSITLSPAGGGEAIPLRLATSEEMAWSRGLEGNHSHLMAYPSSYLELGTEYQVSIHSGRDSSLAEYQARFTVVEKPSEALKVINHYGRVGKGGALFKDSSLPGDGWHFAFNRDLSPENSLAQIVITPPLPEASLSIRRNGIVIKGRSVEGQTYTIAFQPDLTDSLGIPLGETLMFKMTIGPSKDTTRVHRVFLEQ